jgi:hypothetical protein
MIQVKAPPSQSRRAPPITVKAPPPQSRRAPPIAVKALAPQSRRAHECPEPDWGSPGLKAPKRVPPIAKAGYLGIVAAPIEAAKVAELHES